MLIVVAGTPSPTSLWVLHVVRVAAQVLFGDHRFLTSSTLEGFRSDRHSTDSVCTVLYITSPSSRLVKLLVRARASFITAIEAPSDVVSFLVSARGMTLLGAFREYMKSAAALESITSLPLGCHVSSSAHYTPLPGFLDGLLHSCRLEIGPALIEEVAAAIVDQHPQGASVTVGHLICRHVVGAERPGTASALDDRSKALADTLGQQLGSICIGDPSQPIECPLTLFIGDNEVEYDTANPWLSMVGPARCILWGPYVHLPMGKWRARAAIAIRENFSGNVLQIKVMRALSPYAEVNASLPSSGVFEFDMEFEIDEPIDPLEITFTLKEGAIEGALRLISMSFSRIGPLQIRKASS